MTATTINAINNRRALFLRAGSVLVLLVIAYLYFINSMVFNAVARQKLVSEINTLQTQVVALETEYFSLSNNITLELAYNLGFRDAGENTIFAPTLALTPKVALGRAFVSE